MEYYTYEQVVKLITMLMETTTGEGESEAREFVDSFPECYIDGCKEFSEFEGWISIGEGRVSRVNVCNAHKHLLRGYSDEL